MVLQIIGPQLIKTPTIKHHYPELWLGLIIWLVLLGLSFEKLLRPANNPLGFSYCIVIVLATILYFVLRLENKRRESLRVDEEERDRLAFMDLTDQENPYFRYVL